MEKENVIKCGSNSDSPEALEKKCMKEADKLLPLIKVENKNIEVPCWTNGPGVPELIGVICFKKDAEGNVIYEFDDTGSTL